MKNIHINNSYNIWSFRTMKKKISQAVIKQYGSRNPEVILQRSFASMYIEWLLHNIGYYVTKPFCSMKFFRDINFRCKDVDLEEHIYDIG